jgi:hypothetical protein
LSLFCRHNRFTADCPICARAEAPEPVRRARPARRSAAGRPGRTRADAAAAPAVRGPYSAAGPYEHDGGSYEVRLERVPGGLRLAEWSGDRLRRRAPVLALADLGALLAGAAERGLLNEGELARIAAGGGNGRSPGRSGELRDELRAERLHDGRLRVARWLYRPGTRQWELQDAPTMLPAARYAEALAGLSVPIES